MKSKREKLKGTKIYVELPLTTRERETRRVLFKLAEAERAKGVEVKMFSWGLSINGKKMRLDHRTETLVEFTPRTSRPKNS